MSRELLPEYFHIRKKGCMDKTRAIVKILHYFGIRVHSTNTIRASLTEYDDCFNDGHLLVIDGNSVCGRLTEVHSVLSMNDLLKIYGKL